jgi:hypothetical protein
MKEKEVRDRIARFLEKTARTVVVPATMGLGLAAAGCDGHALHGKAADAGPDLVAQNADASTNAPDLADAVTEDDLPPVYPPYVVLMDLPDVAVVVADALEALSVDADRDALVPADVSRDFRFPPTPHTVPLVRPDEMSSPAQGTPPDPLALPEKK